MFTTVLAAALSTPEEKRARRQTSHKFGYTHEPKPRLYRNRMLTVDHRLDIGEAVWTFFLSDNATQAQHYKQALLNPECAKPVLPYGSWPKFYKAMSDQHSDAMRRRSAGRALEFFLCQQVAGFK